MPYQSFRGSNINLVKLHNMQVVLLSLLYEPGLSRIQLARQTHLSNTTITNIVTELLEQGIVTESENGHDDDARRAVGRPRVGIHLNPGSHAAIGVHIGIGVFRVGVVNLEDTLLHNCVGEYDRSLPVEAVLEQITAAVHSVIDASGVDRSRILGVGVGASGLVDFAAGVNLVAPNLGWRDVPMRAYFERAVGLPVVVDNNVRAMAIGEAYFGAGRGVNSLAFVYGRTGVGSGLVFNGRVFRGSRTGAGEIGHTVMLPRGGEPCHCGNNGCLETLIAEPAILRQAEILARLNPGGILAHTAHTHPELTQLDRVFTAARLGDQDVRRMLNERTYYLGLALANVVNLFNPELILLGGIFSQGQDLFIPPALETIRQMSFGGLGETVRLQATSFSWKAGVIGAAALALMHFFYQPEINFEPFQPGAPQPA